MSLPDATMTILDGQLGQVPPSVANASVKLGICSDGVVNQIYSANDNGTAVGALGQGPLVDAAAHTLSVAGGPVYLVPLNPSSNGSAGAVTHGGTGAGTVTVTLAPRVSIAIKITTGGVLGTAFIAFSLNGGAYSTPIVTVPGPGSYLVPGTLTTVTLAAGTYVLNDVYTIGTDGRVTLVGSGPAATNVTHADSPLDSYNVVVTITTAGALGAAVFTVSLDGGNSTTGGQILVPSVGGDGLSKYGIPQTGLVLNFLSTFVLGDTYSFTTTTAGFTNTDVTNALVALLASSTDFGFVHLVGAGANSAAAAATCAVIETQMDAAQVAYRFIFAVMECPTSESDATIAAAFASTAAIRVGVCAGDANVVSPLNGRILRRNIAWVYTARLAKIVASQSPAAVADGGLPNVVSIFRDESKTPLLDAARFVTSRTLAGRQGYYITRGMMMAPSGSDFSRVERRRVMDVACRIVRSASLKYLNGPVRVNPKTGYIDERDAQNFEGDVNSQLSAGVVAPSMASSSSVVMNRTTNILSTNSEPVTVRIVPLGILETIAINIGYGNPALSV